MHLARKGMDRDNFLHDANVGYGAYACMAAWFGFFAYKNYCQYLLNLEHRYCRLPLSERRTLGREHPEMWLMQRDCLNDRSEGFEVWKSVWKIMLQPHKVLMYPKGWVENAVAEYNFEGYAKNKDESIKVGPNANF